jgi:hypothetical protein
MNANGSKSTHITFTTRRGTCPPVHINNVQLPQTEEVKHLGLRLDRRLTWHKHIFAKRKQLSNVPTKSIGYSDANQNYKTILKPIWAYGIQLWGTASTSNIEILERFQSKTAHDKGRTMVCAEYGNTEESPNPTG